jgi:hypothetical protein
VFSEIPATVPEDGNGKASENRDKSEDLPYFCNSELSGRKARIALPIPILLSH